MSESRNSKIKADDQTIEFVLDDALDASSPVAPDSAAALQESAAKPALADEPSETFPELAADELPPLERVNRARLQMQSPERLYFYWSLSDNPYQRLKRLFGPRADNYVLVLRLFELTGGTEEFFRAEAEGVRWFNVSAGREYRVDVGFYSPSSPFVRVLYSNTVETPRKRPSPRPDTAAEWTVNSRRFADVLNVSGFAQDAFDVAVAGDAPHFADTAARTALSELTGISDRSAGAFDASDIRFSLYVLAAGEPIERLKWQIGHGLYAALQKNLERLSSEHAAMAIDRHFSGIDIELEDLESGPAVFGASLVNFPRRLRVRRPVPFSSPGRGLA